MRQGQLTLRDSEHERLSCQALFHELPQGHYKLDFVERLAPRQVIYGPGRIHIKDLTRRDLNALVEDEHAETTLGDHRYRIGGVIGYAGVNLGGFEGASIHGGGRTLDFQP